MIPACQSGCALCGRHMIVNSCCNRGGLRSLKGSCWRSMGTQSAWRALSASWWSCSWFWRRPLPSLMDAQHRASTATFQTQPADTGSEFLIATVLLGPYFDEHQPASPRAIPLPFTVDSINVADLTSGKASCMLWQRLHHQWAACCATSSDLLVLVHLCLLHKPRCGA